MSGVSGAVDKRYLRQTILPGVGPKGQARLAKSCVLIAGAGGLGSASAFYLAGAGIGHIKIVDHDTVDISNLNRQILHVDTALGQPKAVSAANRLTAFNPGIQVTGLCERITHERISAMLGGVDIIVDGLDSYETRQVLNRASLKHGLPYVYAGVSGFDAMISCFVPGQTPCFECIFSGNAPHPDQPAGVIGAAPGLAGSIQAMETVKLLLNVGTPLKNRLMRISGLDMRCHCMDLTPNPACPACGRALAADHP
ncbi:MAG: HesA/MoeB/ThiF family protein [Desulfotignum sp.]|nr:HesA/MoeB/ThiF family protein [Desulfotignum sp.]